MNRIIHHISLCLFAVIALAVTDVRADEELVRDAKQTLDRFLKSDPGLKTFVNNSAGYAIFPNIGKGGFIVGGAHGRGVVIENGKLIGEATVSQASIGAQVGGQTFSEIIFFQTPEALTHFKSSNFEMSADASAVAAAEGASASARYQKGVAVFTMPMKGLMVEAAVGGQKFRFEPLR